MARSRKERLYRNFAGGLNTEFGKLSFPPNALTDALNVVLKKDGALSVRDGIDITSSDGFPLGAFSQDWLPLATYTWRSAAGSSADLLVLGINNYKNKGPMVFFFSVDSTDTMANYVGELSLESLASGVYDGEPMQMAVVGNVLVVAGNCLALPAYILYRNGAIVPMYDRDESLPKELQRGSHMIRLRVRDFSDASATIEDVRPDELTPAHKYDLWNRGWPAKNVAIEGYRQIWGDTIADPIEYFSRYQALQDTVWRTIPRSERKRYAKQLIAAAGPQFPSKSDPYLGGSRSTYGRMNFMLYGNLADPIGSTPRGHFIVDATTMNRGDASSITDLTSSFPVPARYRVVAGFAGRAWYSGSTEQSQANTVFYSQISSGEGYDNLAKCHQSNDPTDPDINEVLDTDGGTLEIEGAGRIMQLIPFSNSIVVLATNGVWEISGGEQGFTPTNARVRKLSSDGVVSPSAGVLAESAVVYWSRGGIYAIQADQTLGTLSSNNISAETIQAYYKTNIPNQSKVVAKAVYDDYNRVVYWLYADNELSNTYYNKALVLDLRLNAFYPISFSISSEAPKVVGAYLSPPRGTSTFRSTVTVDGVPVTVDGEDVYTRQSQESSGFSDMLFLSLDTATGSLYQAALINRDKTDWQEAGHSTTYLAFAETGSDVVDDPSRLKDAVNMTAWFTITEDAVNDEGTGILEFAHQSKCKFSAKWEWTDSAAASRWHTQPNIYQLPVNYTPSGPEGPDNFDLGYTVATVQRSINGGGRAVRFRFENYPGYGFELLGLAIAFTVEESN